MAFPQPLPEIIRAAMREINRPAAFSLAFTPPGSAKELPMVIVVASVVEAWAWAKTPGLKIGALLMADYTPHGAVLAIEIELFDKPDSSMRAYTLLNPASDFDKEMFKLLAAAEQLAVGFGDTKGMLQGVKAIRWPQAQRGEVAEFTIAAIDYNQMVMRDGRFDYAKALAAFDENYAAQRG